MRKRDEILAKVLAGRGGVKFRDFEALLLALGFEFRRQAGSHRVYTHPLVPRPFSIQADGSEAKRYQVRQLRDIIQECGLSPDVSE